MAKTKSKERAKQPKEIIALAKQNAFLRKLQSPLDRPPLESDDLDLADVVPKVVNIRLELIDELGERWSDAVFKSKIREEFPFGTPTGIVNLALGQAPILAINEPQLATLSGLFNVDYTTLTQNGYFAQVESIKKRKRQAMTWIKHISILAPESPGLLLVSRSLAELLKVNQGDRIRITRVFQPTAIMNLDTFNPSDSPDVTS